MKGKAHDVPAGRNHDGAEHHVGLEYLCPRAVVVAPGRHVVRFSFHPFAGALAELAGKLSGQAW